MPRMHLDKGDHVTTPRHLSIRKRHAGGDSFGNVWLTDGAVIDVPHDEALVLLGIKDSGCTLHDPDVPASDDEPDDDGPDDESTPLDRPGIVKRGPGRPRKIQN